MRKFVRVGFYAMSQGVQASGSSHRRRHAQRHLRINEGRIGNKKRTDYCFLELGFFIEEDCIGRDFAAGPSSSWYTDKVTVSNSQKPDTKGILDVLLAIDKSCDELGDVENTATTNSKHTCCSCSSGSRYSLLKYRYRGFCVDSCVDCDNAS